MSFATTLRNRNMQRGVAWIASLGMMLSLMVVFAPAALAHHPEISGSNYCDDDGVLQITLTSTSWTLTPTAYGNHPEVVVEVQLPGASDWHQVGTGAYVAGDRSFDVYLTGNTVVNGFPLATFEGQTIGIRTQVVDQPGSGAGWTNDSGDVNASAGTGNGNAAATSTLALLDCEPPSPEVVSVAVSGECVVEEGQGLGVISIDLSIDGAASVQVYDSSDQPVGDPLTADGMVNVPEGAQYSWVATAADGFEFAGGAETDQGQVDIETCSPPVEPEPAEIVVLKLAPAALLSDADPQFTFETVGFELGDDTLGHNESSSSGPLTPGDGYGVSEVGIPTGWLLNEATCSDGSPIDNIDLSPGETVTCTFHNVIQTEVNASILVTIGSSCITDSDGNGVGTITVQMSAAGGATVVVSSGETVVATFTDDGSVQVPEGQTYTWEATPNEGFEFPEGFVPSGTVTVETCSDEVLASILVTVGSSCITDTEGNGIGTITVDMSVSGGATVVVMSGTTVVGTFTDDGSVQVPEGQTYTWEATPNEGFEFPAGFVPSGTVSIETCSDEELPFTGMDSERLLGLSILLLGSGAMLVFASRRREES